MLPYEKEIAPDVAGWCAVCMKPSAECHEEFPMTKPEVVYYDKARWRPTPVMDKLYQDVCR